MLKNYFIVAWRNFRHNKIFSLINVLGLSIGISAALVIFLVVQYDFSFDHFEKDRDRIYRVVTDMQFAGTPYHNSGVPSPLPAAVKSELSGIEETVGFHQNDPKVTIPNQRGEKPASYKSQPYIIFADNSYFKLIPCQWLAGSPETSLKEPFKVVLSDERAKVYFPNTRFTDIPGKQIIYDDSIRATVSGIVKTPEDNSDFNFKEFISQSTIPAAGLKGNYSWDEWTNINSGSQLFLKLAVGRSASQVESQLKTLLGKYYKESNKDDKNTTVFRLQPLADLHFNSVYGTFGDHLAHKPTLYGLLTVAVFLLILGCINFINLTTAQGSQRAKEIGIRKTLGSSKRHLIFQFLNETLLITLVATVLSVLITPLLLKVFADFIPKNLHLNLLHQPLLLFFLIALIIVISLLSGLYPAFVLSRYKPVLVLKNQAYSAAGGTRKASLRKGLTIFQFLIAQVFVMATLVTAKQIHYILNKDLGFKKDAILILRSPFTWTDAAYSKRQVLLEKLKALPGIQMMSLGGHAPASNGTQSQLSTFTDGKKEVQTDVQLKSGDTNYLGLYHIKILAGRNVQQSDTTKEYLVNETYMHILGYQDPQAILNARINGHPVVGVIADFNQQSLHSPVKPLMFSSGAKYGFIFHIALKPEYPEGPAWSSTIKQIEKAYKNIYPEEDFNYQFFDESIAKFYKSEQDISRLLKWATGLAIFISCLGLLGLVIYTTSLRTKEIGIRKVLGASVTQIISILSKDFIAVVLIAFIIAMPLAWWSMHKWLENFAYRTTINRWIFLASGAFMMLMALFTLSIQTIKAASANPVESLRNE